MYLNPDWEDETDAGRSGSLAARYRKLLWFALAAIIIAGLVVLVRAMTQTTSHTQPVKPVIIQTVILPPPPPPPPPKTEPKPMEQAPRVAPTRPREMEPPKASSPPKAPPTKATSAKPAPAGKPLTAEVGANAGNYGLQAGDGGGDTIGGAGGDGGVGGGAAVSYGAYAAKVQSSLQYALMKNERTRHGHYQVTANLWLSASGRIERVQIVQSSADTDIDAAVSEVLSAQAFNEAPPSGMPQPIKVNISARG